MDVSRSQMQTIDNSQLIAPFMPPEDDGDTFLYTELLDRSKKTSGNRARLVRTYYHRSRAEFEAQMPAIRHLCEAIGVRAYTRLSPRSFKAVGKLCATLMLQHVLDRQWGLLRYAYGSACGRVRPTEKLWLFDIDGDNQHTRAFRSQLSDTGFVVAVIPSRQGWHYITKPHAKPIGMIGVSLHKDNPTNLLIPVGAK